MEEVESPTPTAEEIATAVDQAPNDKVRCWVALAAYRGLRSRDISQLTVDRVPVSRTRIVGMSPDVWRFIREMYDNRCYYCAKGGGNLQMEHRIPLARGGNNDISNIVPACERCNRDKGTKTDDEFFKLLADQWEYTGNTDDAAPARPFPGAVSDGQAVRIPLKRGKRLKLELPSGMKLCTTCREILPISNFGSHRGKKDGLASRCRTCAATASKAWRQANPEKWAEMKMRYRRQSSAIVPSPEPSSLQDPE